MSTEERIEYCKRRGLCVSCGEIRTHKITRPFRQRTPITNHEVKNGMCLVCNPHLKDVTSHRYGGVADVAVTRGPPPTISHGASSPTMSPDVSSGTIRPSASRERLHVARGGPSDPQNSAQRHWVELARVNTASAAFRASQSVQELSDRSAIPSSADGLDAVPVFISERAQSAGAAFGADAPQSPAEADLLYGWVAPRGSGNGLGRPKIISREISNGVEKDAWDVVKSMRESPQDCANLSRQMHRLRAIGKNQAAAVYEVIEVMKRHPRDSRLQAAGCGAVWGVTALDDDQKLEAVDAGAVEAVVGGMKATRDDARLATWGLGCLSCLSVGTGARGTVMEQGALDAVVSSLMAHPREPGVFEWAARLLYSLVEPHVYAGEEDADELREEIADTRMVIKEFRSSARLFPGLIRAMQFHPASFVAQEWSLRFLWVLLTSDTAAGLSESSHSNRGDEDDESNWKEIEPAQTLLRSITDEGGTKVCMDIFRSRPTTERLQEMALVLFCSATDQASWVGSGNTDQIQSVIELMMAYPQNAWIQEETCALLSVWVSAEDDRKTIFAGMGGLKAVLTAMDNHPSADGIHESACHVIWTLSSTASLWGGDDVLLQRIVSKMVTCLTSHSESTLIQGRSLSALANLFLLEGGQSMGDEASEALLIDAVVSVLLSHSSDPALVERACRALSNGCHSDSFGRVAGAIVDSGGVRAIAKGMAACSEHCAVQEEGLAALCGILSSGRDEHRAAVIESSGVEAIRDAMSGLHNVSLTLLLRGMYAVCTVTLCKKSDQSVVRPGVVDAIVKALSGPHCGSNDLLTRSCLALRNFALVASKTGRSRREEAVPKPGEAMEAVLHVLQQRGDNLILQKEACGALFALSSLCTDASSTPLNPVFQKMARVLDINKGDEIRPFNGPILIEALGAMENLSILAMHGGSMAGLSVGIHIDLHDIDVLIATMYEALQDTFCPDVVDGVFGVLLNLSQEQMYADAVIECGGIVSIIDAMQENEGHEGIERKGCAILSRLSTDNLEVKLCIAETDGIEVIISAMVHNPMKASTQVAACRTLSHLTIDKETRTLITQQGGIVLSLAAMSNHPEDAEVQETACEAICGLSCDVHESVLSESNVLGVVIETMRAHIDCPRVQERALGILQNMAMRSSASKLAVASAGGIKEIVLSIKENMTSPEVLERAFTALWSLAVLDGNQGRIVAADGISIIINGMMVSINTLGVQKQACGCLCTLSSNSKCKRLIKGNSGMDAIVFAMWAHLKDESLLVEACRALSSLAVISKDMDGPDDGNHGVVDAVILCMRRYPDSVKLQEITCLALRNLSLSPPNLMLIKQRTDEVEKLLYKAAAKFPGECSQRANQVLTQLFD